MRRGPGRVGEEIPSPLSGHGRSLDRQSVGGVGCRSRALAAGMDATTAARHLRELAAEPHPILTLVQTRRGLRGDLYEQ